MTYEHRVVCIGCGREMVNVHSGVPAIELKRDGSPYRVLHGDVLECPACGARVLSRFGNPTEAHAPIFAREVADARLHDDCVEFE